MPMTRRTFVATSVAGLAGASAANMAGLAWGQTAAQAPPDEDGSRLWLRYAPPGPAVEGYRGVVRQIVVQGGSDTAGVIREELVDGLGGMLGREVPVSDGDVAEGAVIVGTPENSSIVAGLDLGLELSGQGTEGFVIRSTRIDGRPVTVVASVGEIGALYGAYHFLRLMATARPITGLAVAERPLVEIRMLNHWDNLDGSIERGYAGRSLWQWEELPDVVSPRYREYARANASVGINGASVNNVNADARILTPEYLRKVAALADVWRPYGVRMYLSVNFAAPVAVGGLETADPLDDGVAGYWTDKAAEIYSLIPDFGGFLVKANSEGQPGPKDYGRTHAEGANVMARALAPHGGRVIWRAFIYDPEVDPDRANRPYIEFMRLEGDFEPNVLVQIKNGAIDFQPREPFHPLFGGLRETPAMAELQPTQEYLGQARHLVYLGTMWEEFLTSDTHAEGPGSTVGRYVAGDVWPMRVTGMAGVTNPGLDANWCGHHFSQSNWYAFARLAWNHEQTAEAVADEWIRQTLTHEPETVDVIRGMMMRSREIFVNYTMPCGLHHLIGGDHYAPMPQNARSSRPSWTATYYHQAAADGVGFDRTGTGSNHVAQYHAPVRDMFSSVEACPETYLLWFHRLGWDHEMESGRTLWEELCARYHQGARDAAGLEETWASLEGRIDARRHREVAERLDEQVRHAGEWRDQILGYFQQFSGMDIVDPTRDA